MDPVAQLTFQKAATAPQRTTQPFPPPSIKWFSKKKVSCLLFLFSSDFFFAESCEDSLVIGGENSISIRAITAGGTYGDWRCHPELAREFNSNEPLAWCNGKS